ncbi:MAG: methionyl-tRNA formyltransferase [Candidatus Krumholzibacteriota bacterium]|nr:methionyl-tRNA formyltransferase [Candidatus Krumholzibacteriota bacterium]
MVVFFGSPDFSLPTLERLLRSDYRPALVVTQPDRVSGRGKKLVSTPVKRLAEENDVPVRAISSFNDSDIKNDLVGLKPDFFVVVAFGLIFPESVLEMPSRGCVNLHASLLPSYRGASPINRAVVNGDSFTGVTTISMEKKVDAGPVYLQEVVGIDPEETAGELFDRLAGAGASLLIDTLSGIDAGRIEPVPQREEGKSFAPPLKKIDGLIPWDKDAIKVYNHIRGMNPWPGSFSYFRGKYIKVKDAWPCDLIKRPCPPGTVLQCSDRLVVSCGKGALEIKKLQIEGRRSLEAEPCLRGFDMKRGERFRGPE